MIKLKQAEAIKEVFYPIWLANTVVMKKKSEKWRVCVDFTNLNKACPKDHFPMPQIDQLVDATVGHPRMAFWTPSRYTTKYHWLWVIRERQFLSLPLEITTTR